jgi:hypothetical protein
MIDRLREGAAIIYVEGRYGPRKPVPTPAWMADSPPLGGGIITSRVDASPTVTLSTIVLVDPPMYPRALAMKPTLEFCREDQPGIYTPVHPDTEEGQGGQWMPIVQTPQHWRNIPGAPFFHSLAHMLLNVGPLEARAVEYLNGDRFDLRAANVRLLEAEHE